MNTGVLSTSRRRSRDFVGRLGLRMNVKPHQNPPHDFGPVTTEPLMIGPGDHHQLCMLRIRVKESLHTCERSSPILRSMNEQHSYLAAAYGRDTILGAPHIETMSQTNPPERRFDQWPPHHSGFTFGLAHLVADELIRLGDVAGPRSFERQSRERRLQCE